MIPIVRLRLDGAATISSTFGAAGERRRNEPATTSADQAMVDAFAVLAERFATDTRQQSAATFAPLLTARVVALRPDGTILSATDGLHEQPSVDNADHTIEVTADASLLPTLLDLYVDAGWTAVSRVLVALEVAAAASSTWVLMATQRFVYGTAAILLAWIRRDLLAAEIDVRERMVRALNRATRAIATDWSLLGLTRTPGTEDRWEVVDAEKRWRRERIPGTPDHYTFDTRQPSQAKRVTALCEALARAVEARRQLETLTKQRERHRPDVHSLRVQLFFARDRGSQSWNDKQRNLERTQHQLNEVTAKLPVAGDALSKALLEVQSLAPTALAAIDALPKGFVGLSAAERTKAVAATYGRITHALFERAENTVGALPDKAVLAMVASAVPPPPDPRSVDDAETLAAALGDYGERHRAHLQVGCSALALELGVAVAAEGAPRALPILSDGHWTGLVTEANRPAGTLRDVVVRHHLFELLDRQQRQQQEEARWASFWATLGWLSAAISLVALLTPLGPVILTVGLAAGLAVTAHAIGSVVEGLAGLDPGVTARLADATAEDADRFAAAGELIAQREAAVSSLTWEIVLEIGAAVLARGAKAFARLLLVRDHLEDLRTVAQINTPVAADMILVRMHSEHP